MALQLDTLVMDLMFQASAAIDQKTLIDGLGGPDALESRQLLDVDRLDPRAEMELSPSMPFRRRTERRLMILDESVITPRADPAADPMVDGDLRPAKEQLIAACNALPIRLGRLFALGSWGDAVIVARTARDLRGIALLPYALDPQVDVDGKRRTTPLSQKEFEAKLLAFEKRLDELDDEQIIAGISGEVTFERRGDLLIVDVLEADGKWDQRKSMLLEQQLSQIERFSMIPGAPASPRVLDKPKPAAAAPANGAAKPAPEPPAKKPEPKGPPLGTSEIDGKVMLVFPAERFDLEVAAALGKRDWDLVIRSSDNLTGAMRDKLHREGANWIAPLEFLSEVFVDGKPLSKPEFEKTATVVDGMPAMRALEVHFPRFGPVMLLEISGKGRFVTSLDDTSRARALVS